MAGRLIVSLLTMSPAPAIHAAQWAIDSGISLFGGYDDNVRLRRHNTESSARARISPSTTFSVATPRSGSSGTVRIDVDRYESDSNLNTEMFYVTNNSFYNMERSRAALGLRFVKDTTLNSQLEDTGVVLQRKNRKSYIASPTWRYNLNQRTSLDLGYSFTFVDYSASEETGLVDYQSNNFQVSLGRILNQRSTGSVTVGFTTTGNDVNTDSTYAYFQGGGSYEFSETLNASAFAGVRRTETKFKERIFVGFDPNDNPLFEPVGETISNSDWGGTFSASLNKKFLRGDTGLTASRNISNSTSGILINVTRVTLKNTYRFSERLSSGLTLQYYHSKSSNAAATNLNRDYYTVNPSLTWRFTRAWRLSASYRYRVQTYDEGGGNATQNVAYLTLHYQWPRIAVSR
ncbi:MAG TPA: hypothetical protein ENK05_10190 [Gammaproteobacteria bacterium]|nr:hypothetical protein [Gammaproteobacteria bacterium]